MKAQLLIDAICYRTTACDRSKNWLEGLEDVETAEDVFNAVPYDHRPWLMEGVSALAKVRYGNVQYAFTVSPFLKDYRKYINEWMNNVHSVSWNRLVDYPYEDFAQANSTNFEACDRKWEELKAQQALAIAEDWATIKQTLWARYGAQIEELIQWVYGA